MLISPEYRQQNMALHQARKDYGNRGARWADEVWNTSRSLDCHSWLDYGCGKATLGEAMPPEMQDAWQNYDPAIPLYSTPPMPADLVVCVDVLEHVEPNAIEDVLDDLQRLSRKAVLLFVDMTPASKTLPDGRNAHLLQRPIDWWLCAFLPRWLVRSVVNTRKEFLFVGETLGSSH